MIPETTAVRVPAPLAVPIRLYTFLKHQFPHVSKRRLQAAIKNSVRVNKQLAKKGTLLFGGEEVSFPHEGFNSVVVPNPNLTIPIVYEDNHMIVLDKPAGMPCHPILPTETETVANFLTSHEPRCRLAGSAMETGLVHRLDTGTSGLLLAAKNPEMFTRLRQQFSRSQVFKEYIGLCVGQIDDDLIIDLPLAHSSRDRRMMVVVEPGSEQAHKKVWKARTEVHVLWLYSNHTLLSLRIDSGVTHQIRLHLASAGHPLAGENLYARPLPCHDSIGLDHHFLHAARLVLRHPANGDLLWFESPLPKSLRKILAWLPVRGSRGTSNTKRHSPVEP